ncbi:MAG TPA: DUF1697 domain-containing protein [Chitinophagales bacterium]|nr:DUF1697 domain-containing protein [Chitinophagales bacterium]
MSVAVSILRGINVSGHRKIPMAELKLLYSELKLKNISTYIQSGNVVFSADKINSKALAKSIEQKILEKYNFDVPVIIRTIDEIQSTLNNNPFLKEKKIEIDKLHVTFLADQPDKENLEKLKSYHYEPDRFIITGKEVYLYCPNGYGNTKLSNNFFESKLKITATTRNWRTVNELLKIALLL